MLRYWKLDDGSGTTAVDAVNAVNGTVAGVGTWVAGKVGGALSFNGTNTGQPLQRRHR